MVKLCNIINTPSHYRKCIYKLIDNSFDTTFIFGDSNLNVKTLDIKCLNNAFYTHDRHVGKVLFQWGVIPYAFKTFDFYILTPGTNIFTMWLFLLLVKVQPRKKVFLWTHGMYGKETMRQRMLLKLQFFLAGGALIYGNYAKCLLVKNGICKDSKIFVIHNSLDYDSHLKIRKQLDRSEIYKNHFNNSNPVLIFIGRLTKIKKLDLIIGAVSILKKKGENYNVVFVGDGPESERLKHMALNIGLEDQFWFYGASYDENKNAELIYNADVCVSPGNVGLTSIHCFTFGTPVITHNNFSMQMPEFEVIEEDKTGAFFEMNNVNSLAVAISRWFNTNRDNRELIRKRCYDIIDREWNPNYQMDVLRNALGNID